MMGRVVTKRKGGVSGMRRRIKECLGNIIFLSTADA